MHLILKDGTVRQACDRCHRVRVLDIRRGVCAGCRSEELSDAQEVERTLQESSALAAEAEWNAARRAADEYYRRFLARDRQTG